MPLQVYNTLSRSKEVFKPLVPNHISFYLCGPTVYNYIHIGNARSTVAFDTIRRYLEYRGYTVNFISNFTDVDDKIIKAAKEEGVSAEDIANKYIAAFYEDTGKLNVKPATKNPRVMENIPDIIEFISDLVDKGFAYESSGDIYFRTEKFEDYGKLSNKSIDELLHGASGRLEDDLSERKESPIDFALWKAVKAADEVSWDSPWGRGRPGWHIECSVMATKYLGNTIDIHAGGQDLEFPHHENEIAQSESHSGHPFAHYWLHNGFVTIGEAEDKMSKSLGNFVLLRDLLAETDPMVVRYLLSSVHYRRPLRYDETALNDAKHQVVRLREVLRKLNYRLSQDNANHLEGDAAIQAALSQAVTDFTQAMDDDFQVGNGLSVVFDLVKQINIYLEQSDVSQTSLLAMKSTLVELLEIFGLDLDAEETTVEDDIQALIDERNQARKDKNFARADEIRNHLKAQGIILDDTPQGTQWKRVDEL
ncbi:cysteine--tRNA ligase [Fundicoccus culcitae]|uniref:Cysteine--tRNA ligase n=1 Tax=Fundicoccus culcitae TaxID=2969821 RepID=A0ABY5P2W4_9LACT|nr:cysteine--tRNA ligase [Fundicoccus culcitae]UUX33042.1 cysteine--tRNA ligase [Fundicoccus culcitae]